MSGVGHCDQQDKSHLVPSQRIVYLSMVLDSLSFRASPRPVESRQAFVNRGGISVLRHAASVLLGVLSFLTTLVPGGAASACGLSSSFSVSRRISWTTQLWSSGTILAVGTSFGGWISLVWRLGCRCLRCPLTSPSGLTLLMWAGALT